MKYDTKYDDYVMEAISMEGSKGWSIQWQRECDESFQKYKAEVDQGGKVSAKPFLAAQKLIFAKMKDVNHCEQEPQKNQSVKPKAFKRKTFRRARRRKTRRFWF